MAEASSSVAIIFGATGLVGVELAKRLITSESNWKVYGIARRPEINPIQSPKYQFISCDLLNSVETKQKLSPLQDVTHIFWITWTGQDGLDSQECCQQNKEMMSNALDAVFPKAKELKHISLQTGMNHYVSVQGPWNAEEKEEEVVYYNEERPRIGAGNFYYVLEDLIKERLSVEGNKVSWSVIRPGLLMGCSHRTLYNFMGSLCVYGALCKHLNLPFVFGGTRECWEEFCIDGSDARLVAEQHIWAATNDEISSIHGQAFNAINGPSFTWKEIWPTLGKKFGVEVPNEMFVKDFWYAKAMCDKGKAWEEIVAQQGLVVTTMEDLANWGFLDMLFRFPKKMLGSREKADRAGFAMTYKTLDSILYWIETLRDEKLVP